MFNNLVSLTNEVICSVKKVYFLLIHTCELKKTFLIIKNKYRIIDHFFKKTQQFMSSLSSKHKIIRCILLNISKK